ncbi:hypothetical protein [Streptomyces sp. NPDC002779]|uniref:hypothetical protein n=1 Tax=Streptomyces sp. NPDC002779 TaxID=3364664 RepID=UPI0036A60129
MAVVPAGDMLIVLSEGGPATTAYGVRGLAAAAVAVTAALLLRERPTATLLLAGQRQALGLAIAAMDGGLRLPLVKCPSDVRPGVVRTGLVRAQSAVVRRFPCSRSMAWPGPRSAAERQPAAGRRRLVAGRCR